jgi:hypothetical protein
LTINRFSLCSQQLRELGTGHPAVSDQRRASGGQGGLTASSCKSWLKLPLDSTKTLNFNADDAGNTSDASDVIDSSASRTNAVAAAALAQYLLSREHGSEKVRDMIVDDIREAQGSGNKEHVLTLLHVLHHFLITHQEARPPEHPWSHRF